MTSIVEQERRITAENGAGFGKLRSVELLRQFREQFAACDAAMPEPTMTIDTTTVEPRKAALSIAETLRLPLIAASSG
jgi:hypothetical protein